MVEAKCEYIPSSFIRPLCFVDKSRLEKVFTWDYMVTNCRAFYKTREYRTYCTTLLRMDV